MTAAQFELLDVDQAVRLLQWRFKKLTDAGHDAYRALLMAAKPDIEIRLASDLLSAVGGARRDGEALARTPAVPVVGREL